MTNRVIILTDDEVDRILEWAEVIDDEWDLTDDDKELEDKLKKLRLKG